MPAEKQKWDQARDAILDRILELAKEEGKSHVVLNLAEAYAWLSSPGQSHGGNPKVSAAG
jgi:hypothetical protein